MTLIELLCVVTIIALLTALLLPVVNQAQARAKRIRCVDHLRQVGIGLVNFGNEHGGHFPMSVPASAGGILEYAQSGYLIEGDFYFSFRHFQAASNELVTPRLMVCPADTRLPATSFTTFNNSNLSHFIGVNAEFTRPTSILAGDRNLTNDYVKPATLLRLGQNHALRWTAELHRFKGNLLFSDGHVEEKNSPGMIEANGQVPAVATLALPTVRQSGTLASSPRCGYLPSAANLQSAPEPPSSHSWPSQSKSSTFPQTASTPWRATSEKPAESSVPPESSSPRAPPEPPEVVPSTNGVTAAASPRSEPGEDARFPLAGEPAALAEGLAKTTLVWFYLLLLLIVIAALILRKLAYRKHRPAGRPYPKFR